MIFGGLSQTRGNMAEKFVHDRRREENNHRHLNTYLKSDLIARHVAQWEDKGAQTKKNRFTKQRIQELRAQFEAKNFQRKLQLKHLYDQESQMYEDEIRRLRPTADQVKQQMIARVEQLKSQREFRRQEDVAEKLDRRFMDSADELRKVGSDIKQMKIKHERDIQMLEKQKKLEQNYAEEMIYAELWRRDVILFPKILISFQLFLRYFEVVRALEINFEVSESN